MSIVDCKDKAHLDAYVGRFKFNISDNRLEQAILNETILRLVDVLYDDVFDYWDSYGETPRPNETEYHKLLAMTEHRLGHVVNNETRASLFRNATETMAENYANKRNKTITGFDDLTSFYLNTLSGYWYNIYYWEWGFLMGVGRTVTCSNKVNNIIASKDEWAKLGSATAGVLMALIPAILSFGTL